jgi:hypothetical protein
MTDLRYLETRKQFLVDGSRVADLYLEDMLQSQERLQLAEYAYLDSQVRGVLAWVALSRATGTLGTTIIESIEPGSHGGEIE